MDIMAEIMYDLLIIGAGPAGMGAAVYAARAGIKFALIDQSTIIGGQVLTTYEVDNYLGLPQLSGSEISNKFQEHVDKLGVPFIIADVQKIENLPDKKIIHTDKGDFEARAILLATGASHSMLGVSGEQKLAGMGVSYCATCDGAFFRNKEVIIVGGGNTALEDALFLANQCQKVTLVHRRNSFRAEKMLIDAVLAQKNINILYDSEVIKINGNQTVTSAEISNKGQKITIPISGIFIAIGYEPDNTMFSDLEINAEGYIVADESCRTNLKGVFVAGDTRTKPVRQIVTACADGAVAAINAVSYLLS